ncbi:MAG TPA: ATP-binding cassette domain-containing protein, partial [Nocardioidaceae bacterium]|nr:ATP-binding cassette domain-containing protein [Nocardioidaceae bacterium]
LRIVSGTEQADFASLAVPADLAYLGQEPSFRPGATVGDVLDEALAPLHHTVARLEALATRLDEGPAQDEYAALLEWAVLHDAWDADHRAEAAAARLGLETVERDRPVDAMSGGQRMRLALAALITRRPECVLLDEPTNHLDDAAVAFLEEFLLGLRGVVVVASHDRTFLDNVCSVVLDLDPMHLGVDGDGGNHFSGGYTDYLRAKHESRVRWEQAYLAHQGELDDLRRAARTTARSVAPNNRPPRDNDKFIHHVKGQKVAKAVSRRVRDTERRIEEREREKVPKPPRALAFRGDLTHGRGRATITARDLVVPGRVHLPRLDVAPGEHLLVTGANGSGKSTLLQVMAGEVPAQGHLDVSAHRVGHLPQEVVFARPDRSALEVYAERTGPPVPLGDLGLLHPRDLGRPVGALSVGQQRRLGLALVVAQRPDLLLLDEPTNHISLALAEELEDALRHAAGTVVVASHDRWLRRRWEGPVLGL